MGLKVHVTDGKNDRSGVFDDNDIAGYFDGRGRNVRGGVLDSDLRSGVHHNPQLLKADLRTPARILIVELFGSDSCFSHYRTICDESFPAE